MNKIPKTISLYNPFSIQEANCNIKDARHSRNLFMLVTTRFSSETLKNIHNVFCSNHIKHTMIQCSIVPDLYKQYLPKKHFYCKAWTQYCCFSSTSCACDVSLSLALSIDSDIRSDQLLTFDSKINESTRHCACACHVRTSARALIETFWTFQGRIKCGGSMGQDPSLLALAR